MKIETENIKIQKLLNDTSFLDYFSSDVSPYVEIHTFTARETLCHEGDQLPYFYYLVSGKAKAYMSHKNGKVSIISFFTAPSIIGEMGLIGAEQYAKGIETLTQCVCLALPIEPVRDILLSDNHFLLKLCKFLGEKALSRTEKYAKSFGYPLENRLAAFILLTEQAGVYLEKHTEASEYLNVSYRHLMFTLNLFCKRGWLQKEGRKYQIADAEPLRHLAAEIDLI